MGKSTAIPTSITTKTTLVMGLLWGKVEIIIGLDLVHVAVVIVIIVVIVKSVIVPILIVLILTLIMITIIWVIIIVLVPVVINGEVKLTRKCHKAWLI